MSHFERNGFPKGVLSHMARKRKTSLDLAAAMGLASLHAGITLWHRWPMIAMGCSSQGTAGDASEMNRMVSEKMGAMVEGAWEAQAELMRLTGAAMTGRLDFAEMSDVPAAIASAGLRPAFRAVKANSHRLSRR